MILGSQYVEMSKDERMILEHGHWSGKTGEDQNRLTTEDTEGTEEDQEPLKKPPFRAAFLERRTID